MGLINLELMDPPLAKRGSNNPWPQHGAYVCLGMAYVGLDM